MAGLIPWTTKCVCVGGVNTPLLDYCLTFSYDHSNEPHTTLGANQRGLHHYIKERGVQAPELLHFKNHVLINLTPQRRRERVGVGERQKENKTIFVCV